MFKFIFTATFALSCMANSMFFEVDSISLNRELGSDFLGGVAHARDVYIKYDAVEFDLTENGELFLVNTFLFNNRINFQKDNLNLTTHLPQFTEIDLLNMIYAKEAKIEFAETGFFANGPQLSIGAEQFLFDIKDVDIKCQSDEFTFNLDEICLKDMHIKPLEGKEFAIVEIKQSGASQSNVNIRGKEVAFKEDSIIIDAQSASGNLLNSSINFKNINIDCYKDPNLSAFNLDLIFAGCLEESRIAGKEIKLLREGMPFNVFDGQVYFEKQHLGLIANQLEAQTKKGEFTFTKIEARCVKIDPSDKEVDAVSIYEGCLRRSDFSIQKISEDKKESDKNRIRDLKITVADGHFNMTAKLKSLFTFKFKAAGKLDVHPEQREVRIKVNRARVAGMTATKFVLKFVMKFINSDSVSLKGETIIIKY